MRSRPSLEFREFSLLLAIQVDDLTTLQRASILNEDLLHTNGQQQSCSINNLDATANIDDMKLTAFNVLLKGSKLSINTFVDTSEDKQGNWF